MAATLESVRKAISKKGHSPAFAWLADLERQSGDLVGALQHVQDGLLFFPENIAGLIVLSAVYFDLEQWDAAETACRKVLSKDPFCLSALRRLGDVCEKLGKMDERNFYYQRLHDLDPWILPWSEEYRTQSQTEAGQSDAAVQDAAPAEESQTIETPDQEEAAPVGEAPALEPVSPAAPPDLQSNAEQDPFSSLSALLPKEQTEDADISFDSLEHSLDEALAGLVPGPAEQEFFPADDISGGDISSALSGIFGSQEVNAEGPGTPSPALNIPTSLEDEEPEAPPSPFAALEPKPIPPVVPETEEPSAVAPAPAEPPVAESQTTEAVGEEEPKSLSSAFDDIFGEDELPEEFVPLQPEESSAVPEEPQAEEAATVSAPVPEASEPELSPPAEPAAEPVSFEKSAEQNLMASCPVPDPASSILNLDEATESLDNVLAASQISAAPGGNEEPQESVSPAAATAGAEFEQEVSSSLNALFGEDDELQIPSEPVAPAPAESVAPEERAAAEPMSEGASSLAEDVLKAEDSLQLPEPGTESAPEKGLASALDSSFSALFGDDDDDLTLPPQKPVEPETLTAATPDEDKSLSQSLDTSFSALFAEPETAETKEAPPEEKKDSPENKNIRDEVSGAFDQLFSTPSDAAPEEPMSQDSGNNKVDFLMSGDSDDAVETALVEDPASSLNKKMPGVDGRLNTRTLAEIYFEQGLYDEALTIYRDLAAKEPGHAEITERIAAIEKKRAEKMGEH